MRCFSGPSIRDCTLQLAAIAAVLATGGLGCSDAASGASVGGKSGSTATGGAGSALGGTAAGGAIGGVTSAGGTSGNSSGGSSGASGSATTGGAGSSAGRGSGGLGGAGGTASGQSGPPMGWASWNSFAAKINLSVIKGQADAMASSGLKAAGYQYVNIDEGWWQGTRDASGNITVDTTDWPGGMQAAADYIHGLGLKAGIYTDAGKDGCGYYYPTGRPAAPGSGSEGHYDEDFLQFSKWGFDFVKVDWCGGSAEGVNPKTAYQGISDAIKKATAQTARPMVLSICDWGNQNPWDWAPGMSTMWRTSQDIIYYGNSADVKRMLSNFDSAQHATAQSPGHYNDPDMLIVGMSGFSLAQNRTHLALWAISGAPLLAGNKLDSMSAETKGVLTNSEVIAIDQDPLGKQGTKVSDSGGQQVYSKVLAGTGRRAVLLLNRSASTAMLTVRFADIGLGASASVRDVWAASDLGMKTTSYSASVASNDSVLLLVTE
jgi:Alpha galactosidase A/Alpha galactosidase C-terminal beta sandwich domain